MVNGIKKRGRRAKTRFIELTGAVAGPSGIDRDLFLDDHRVAVRLASAMVNQIRAVRYLPLAVWEEDADRWYVLSADQVIELVVGRAGQHGSNPLENQKRALSRIKQFQIDSDQDLRNEMLAAIERAARWQTLRRAMVDAEEDARAVAAEIVGRIQRILSDDPPAI